MISVSVRDMAGVECGTYAFEPSEVSDAICNQLLHEGIDARLRIAVKRLLAGEGDVAGAVEEDEAVPAVIGDVLCLRPRLPVPDGVAESLAGHLRNTDVCGRWGGEEFIVMLQGVNLNSISRIAEKLRAMIASSVITVNGGEQGSVTASIGAAVVRDTDSMTSLVERADQLMYRSKQLGRNRVTLEE